jgi:hypothetical protein
MLRDHSAFVFHTLPVLVPAWMVTSRSRAFTVTSTPLKRLEEPPMLFVKV